MNPKEHLLRWPIGPALMKLRDRIEIVTSAWQGSQGIGTLANDAMATRLLTRICEPGKTFVDVGAHIGSIIAMVLDGDHAAQIEAIEAIPEKVASLKARFPQATIHCCAVGESEGEVRFYVNTSKSGYSSLGRPSGAGADTVREIVVPLKTLDNILLSRQIDVMKFDVEGAELGALRGASQIIGQCRPLIMFESVDEDVNHLGYSKEDMWSFHQKADYSIVVPNRLAHDGIGLGQDGFLESHLYPRRTTNYFAIPNERRTEFRDRARRILKLI